jgi:hypothetical protein
MMGGVKGRVRGSAAGCMRAAALILLALALATPLALRAQAGAPTVTVIGVVVDSASGVPVNAARISLGADGAGVATNARGQFALPNVPLGTRKLVVTRLGYVDLEVVLDIADPMGGVLLRLPPEPVQLPGVSTKAATEGDLRGRVVDAETGEPIPLARLTLTRDGVRGLGKRLRGTDSTGFFELPDVEVGGYVLRVERLGYTSTLQALTHEVPGPPVQIALKRDFRRTAAIAALTTTLKARTQGDFAMDSDSITEGWLNYRGNQFMDQFLMYEAPHIGLSVELDEKGKPVVSGGRLYIDDLPRPLDILLTYSSKEFYRIDSVECATSDTGLPITYIFMYTYAYFEEQILKPSTRKFPVGVVC